uniref:Transketolase b n=1 Tax=Labrus bergylta TaxID=56723 RepID=A0A3Q3EQK8_9LABR
TPNNTIGSLTKTTAPADLSPILLPSPPAYKKGEKMATRRAYGTALARLGKSSQRVVALDGDTKNSTFSDTFRKAFPERYIECFIAEQNMVGVAIGCATRDRTVAFASTFSAFLARAYDQIRMGAISQTNVNLVGSHCGVSIGEDGPSQMALEDLAMFRAIPTCTVFYPSDAVSTERAVELSANTKVDKRLVLGFFFFSTVMFPEKGLTMSSCFKHFHYVLRASVSSVPVDRRLQSSILQMRSLKWALPR